MKDRQYNGQIKGGKRQMKDRQYNGQRKSSSIYGIWLPLRYLQIFVVICTYIGVSKKNITTKYILM
jgi:hypothetical protein